MGSNADLPIVGGSILAHDHFQGGRYTFPMERAPVEHGFTFPGFEDVRCGIVKWPMSVLRLACADPGRLVDLAERVLTRWRSYTDESAVVYAETDGVMHNTITPIARRRGGDYELDLVLRKQPHHPRTPPRPLPPARRAAPHKGENIGLIEVMAWPYCPRGSRASWAPWADGLVSGAELRSDPLAAPHADWAEGFAPHYRITAENARDIVRRETGLVFARVLEHAGVFKRTDAGREAFLRFLSAV